MIRRTCFVVMSAVFLFTIDTVFAMAEPAKGHVAARCDKGIVILYENDVHCAIDGYGAMERLRRSVSDTAWVAVTCSGDFLQGGTAGALSKGQYIVDVMRAMDYDAVCLGNHEFDYGIPRQLQLLKEGELPVTSVNFRDLSGDTLVYAPYIMRRYGDKSVAFVGVVTPSTMESESYAFGDAHGSATYDLCVEDVYERVQRAVDDARDEGADYVIVLSHLGEAPTVHHVDSYGLVAATHGVDAVLDGHTHSVVECRMIENSCGRMVPVTQTGTKFAYIGKLFISRSGGITTVLVPTSGVPDNGTQGVVQHTVDSIKCLMASVVSEVICHSGFALAILDDNGRQMVRYAETNAGDLVTDALREYTMADVAMYNGGGIRNGIDSGEVKVGDVIAMLPYNNKVGVLKVTGRQLVATLEKCCGYSPVEVGEFPQVAGMRFTLQHGSPNMVTDVEVFDRETGCYLPVESDKVYTVASMEYIISGGGFYNMLGDMPEVKSYDTSDTDVVIWYLKTFLKGSLPDTYMSPQGRIKRIY